MVESKLTSILTRLILDAIARRDERQKQPLSRGLYVELYVDKSGAVHLCLWREENWPGDDEWRTVMRHWPQPLPDPWPVPRRQRFTLAGHKFRRCLMATWKPPRPEFGSASIVDAAKETS